MSRTNQTPGAGVRRVAAWAVWTGLLLGGLASCSLLDRFRSPGMVGPPITFYRADTSLVEIAGPPDSVLVEPAEAARRSPPARAREGDSERAPGGETESSAGAAVADSVEARAPAVSVDLPDEERVQLWRATLDDLAEANALIDSAAEVIDSPEGIEELQTVRGLIEQARAALERKDLQAAANLARKARILAEKLPAR